MVKILSAHGIALLVLNIALISSFIALFFFTVGVYIENLVVRKQIKIIIDDFASTLDLVSTPELVAAIAQSVQSADSVDVGQDQAVADANHALRKKAFLLISVALMLAVISVFALWTYSGRSFSLPRLFSESMGLLVAVIVIETLFYFLVAANYRSIDPNTIKEMILRNVDDYIGN